MPILEKTIRVAAILLAVLFIGLCLFGINPSMTAAFGTRKSLLILRASFSLLSHA
jgi:uncharacterized membrane protein YesL